MLKQIVIKALLFQVLMVLQLCVSAQGEANIWYFGNYAGLDFNYDPPRPLTDGKLKALEGCASVADKNGKMLFYTDGSAVWDRKHNIMKDGTGLKGHNSSSQSAIIVPKPYSSTSYYIFTVDGRSGTKQGAYYNEIDLNQNNGDGSVVVKNASLIPTPYYEFESVCATPTKDKTGYWVCYVRSNANILAFLVTDTGVVTKPVVSYVRNYITNNTISHCMKFSLDGSMMSVYIQGYGLLLSKFDNATGKFSQTFRVSDENYIYSVEFSPDSKLMYTSKGDQYDVSFFDSATIVDSKFKFHSIKYYPYGMQLGPDSKIYITSFRDTFLHVINNPNVKGPGCNFVAKQTLLAGRECQAGLPNILPSFLISGIQANNFCLGDTTEFTLANENFVDSVFWDFGDPSSDLNNYSSKLKPKHVYAKSGEYSVKLIVYWKGEKQETTKKLKIISLPNIDLGPDVVLCEEDSVLLDPKLPAFNVVWQDGTNASTYTVSTPGTYFATIYEDVCYKSDTVEVKSISNALELPRDTVLCDGDKIVIRLSGFEKYVWQDGSSNSTYTIKSSGTYKVTGYSGTCTASDSLNVTVLPRPFVELGSDTTLCLDESTNLTVDSNSARTILWSDGTENSSITVHQEGLYWVKISETCSQKDSIYLRFIPCNPILEMPNIMTPNDDGLNDVFKPILADHFYEVKLSIYNRWGELLSELDMLRETWDGLYEGKEVPGGTYFWIADTKTYQGESKTYSGAVTLIR